VKTFYEWTANLIVVVHIATAIFLFVGWMFRSIQPFYLVLLVAWPLSWVVLGCCPLTKWELLLRKKNDPSIDPNTEKIQYMMKKYFDVSVPSRPIFIGGISVFFALFALSIWTNFY
jgi:hypothetical protein